MDVGHRAAIADERTGTTVEEVWARRWREEVGDVRRFATLLLGGDVHAAEDVAQEAAVRLWQHPELLEDDRSVTGWLRTVARNIVIDRSRRQAARPTEVALGFDVDAESADPFEHVHAAASIATMLSVLSPLHRRVVYEVYVRDRPLADVATDLGIPLGTVKSRCHTALRRLRAATVPPAATSPCLCP